MMIKLILLMGVLFFDNVFAAATPQFSGQAEFDGYYSESEFDVGTIPSCDDTVNDGMSQSAIQTILNNGNRVTCFNAGTYSHDYTISVDGSSGSSNMKWIRLSGSSTTHPVDLSAGSRATIDGEITFNDADYWIIHRMAIDGEETHGFTDYTDSSNIVWNMFLAEYCGTSGSGDSTDCFDGNTASGDSNHWYQNGVARFSEYGTNRSVIIWSSQSFWRIVNNEVYDIMEHDIQCQGGDSDRCRGGVIENNDFYYSPAMWTDGSGNPDPNCTDSTCPCCEMKSEGNLVFKSGASEAAPLLIIHNRIWGGRRSDTSICCLGGGARGTAIGLNAKGSGILASYIEVSGNIIVNQSRGVTASGHEGGLSRNLSVIGNIIHDLDFNDAQDNRAIDIEDAPDVEVYFNTISDADVSILLGSSNSDTDIQANVFINSGASTGSMSGGTYMDYNAFYNTLERTSESPDNNIVLGTVAAGNFEEFCFQRKRWTGPEEFCIPDVRPTTSSPHYQQQSGRTIGNQTGTGVGVDDDTISF